MSEIQDAPPTAAAPRRHWLRWIAGSVAALLLIFVLIHLFESKKPARTAAPQVVKVAKAARGDMPEVLSELGTVTPNATVTVLPQLSGYLTEVGYKEGEDVKKGQFLAQIDPRQYEIDLQQAQAALLKDQAALSQARADLARYHELSAQKAIAEQTVADQEFLVKQEEAQVKLDEANIAQFQLDLIYCRITAPVSGRVGLRLIDPGNYVTASSSPGIVVITTMKPTTVEFTVAQNDIGKVIERVNSGAQLAVTAYTSDNSQQIATGTLYALNNQMATSTGTVTLRAKFANDDEALFPNEFVNIKILVDTLQQAVLVPTPAVLTGAPGDYVYFVNANNTVSVRKVTLGPSDGQHTAILSGLAADDTVVVDGTDRLTDGAGISISSPKPAAAAGAATPTPGPAPGSKAKKRPSASAQGASSST
ncbi:MAG TPA: efflux RND transporter periplasmic adaptor subunit [Steroidobacteraceae bacterium]|jgi:multidrug efflux system membrane fusion protein|nr:efflux RND transporter periplasmic adaptor subunit [Steroidobacteraceae bacterium]